MTNFRTTKVDLDEDEMSLDTVSLRSLLWNKRSRKGDKALSPQKDKAKNDKAQDALSDDKDKADKALLDGRTNNICDEFWEDFVLMSKVCLLRDSEADLYDVFDTIRVKFLGAWGYSSEYVAKVDAEIDAEYRKGLM